MLQLIFERLELAGEQLLVQVPGPMQTGGLALIVLVMALCLPRPGAAQKESRWKEVWRTAGGLGVDDGREVTVASRELIARTSLPQAGQMKLWYDGTVNDGEWVVLTLTSSVTPGYRSRYLRRRLRWRDRRHSFVSTVRTLVEIGDSHTFTAFVSPRVPYRDLDIDLDDLPLAVNLIVEVEEVEDGRVELSLETEIIERD